MRLSGRERNIIKVNKVVQHLTVMALDPTRATTTKQILHIKCVLYFKQDANIEYSIRPSAFSNECVTFSGKRKKGGNDNNK